MEPNLEGKVDIFQYEFEQRSFITKVFGWMSLGLFITAIIAYFVAFNPNLSEMIFDNPLILIGLLTAELLLVAWLVGWVEKMDANMATIIFLFYAALNGLTLSVIFIMYTVDSIFITFVITAVLFGIMSLYGYVTKTDLTSWGNLLLMSLIGIIIGSFANFWINSERIYWITTYVGIITFVGLIAYDTQKIKKYNVIGNEGTDEDRKEAIIGALDLYLDFINLFLKLLRVLGKRRR